MLRRTTPRVDCSERSQFERKSVMAASKEFYEAASKDKALWDEAERAMHEALAAFLKERGLEKEAAAAIDEAVEKVASAHGFAPEASARLDLDELDAVAGGVCACVNPGGGKGTGKNCSCGITGYGENDSGKVCACAWGGVGEDD